MKILVLEDSPWRVEVFKEYWPECVVVDTYKAAVKEMKSQVFDMIWLDHDIIGNKNGCDVAYWIAHALPKSKRPKQIYVHSWSRNGAAAIRQTLNEGGLECVVEPFSEEMVVKIKSSV